MKSVTPFRNFLTSRHAVIATEFALVAPIMILLWVGLVEFATAFLVAQKVEIAAQSAADIIAQDEFTNQTKLANTEEAIKTILLPYSDTNMGYRIASIVADSDGTNTIDWEKGGGITVATPAATIADNLTTANDSVIVVRVTYKHIPVFVGSIIGKSMFGASITLDETVFAKPRLVPIIPCEDCP